MPIVKKANASHFKELMYSNDIVYSIQIQNIQIKKYCKKVIVSSKIKCPADVLLGQFGCKMDIIISPSPAGNCRLYWSLFTLCLTHPEHVIATLNFLLLNSTTSFMLVRKSHVRLTTKAFYGKNVGSKPRMN